MPKAPAKKQAKSDEPSKAFEPKVVKPAPPHESYAVIKRGDRYVVQITVYGRVLHDFKDYARPEDAAVRMKELQGAS